jgi:hypothetical protein
MIRKRVRIGDCKTCHSDVISLQVMMEDPMTIRGIQLTWATLQTGYWAACSNEKCPHHWGEGTLPERPRDMFAPVEQRSANDIRKDLDALGDRIAAAQRGEWPDAPEPQPRDWDGQLPGG